MTDQYVVMHVDTERGWRGGQRQVLLLARELDRLGHRSVIVARRGAPLAERAAREGLTTVTLAPRWEFDPVAALALRRLIHRERVHIVHAHAAHASALSALATVRSRARFVITRRVDFPPKANPLSRWKYRRADALIAVSEAVARSLVTGRVVRDRVTVATSGIDLSAPVAPATREALTSLGVPPGATLIVCVAALVPHKDPLCFVRAFAEVRRRVPAAHALLVGEGPLRLEVERLRATLGLEHCLHLAGFHSDPASLIAAADAFALSSCGEGLGTVLLDAMRLGTPIAATRAGGIPEVVEDGTTGLTVPVGDASALGAALARLLVERKLAQRLVSQARQRVRRFSIAHTVARTLAVYEKTLRGDEHPSIGRGEEPAEKRMVVR